MKSIRTCILQLLGYEVIFEPEDEEVQFELYRLEDGDEETES